MKKSKCIFIVLLVVLTLVTFSTRCLAAKGVYGSDYSQYNDDNVRLFVLDVGVVNSAKTLPEYQDYLKGTYEMFCLLDGYGSDGWILYFVKSGSAKGYITGKFDNREISLAGSWVRYTAPDDKASYPFTNRSTGEGALVTGRYWNNSYLGFTTLPIYTDKTCSTVFFTGVQLEERQGGTTEEPGITPTPTPPDWSSTGPLSWIANGFTVIGNYLSDLLGFLNPFSDKFILKNVNLSFGELLDRINPFSDNFILKNVDLSLGNIFSSIGKLLGFLNPLSNDFILKDVIQGFADILSFLNPFSDNFLGKKLMELLQNLFVFLFVPSEEDLKNIFAPVNAKFAFVGKFNALSAQIQHMLETGEGSPVFKLKLNSKYVSGEFTILDLSFFAPYKPYSDMVITAFVYLLFAYRTIKNLPETISGLNSVSDIGRRC